MQKYFTITEVAKYLDIEKNVVFERLKDRLLSASVFYDGEIDVVEVGGDGKPTQITGLMGVDGIW
ncbi:MAG: hypothetical protein U9R69_11045 [Thermodesulfobacteriota bacterium]|nr:hypothetical protein [Thermodesulfobacteriota bacterium]